MNGEQEAGPTGKFPEGKLNKSDDGELMMAMAVDHEKKVVILNFATPVAWIGLPKEQALALGESIINKANELP